MYLNLILYLHSKTFMTLMNLMVNLIIYMFFISMIQV